MLIEKYCDACAEKEVKWQLMDIICQTLIIISYFTSYSDSDLLSLNMLYHESRFI
jgi:hypothetical protein